MSSGQKPGSIFNSLISEPKTQNLVAASTTAASSLLYSSGKKDPGESAEKEKEPPTFALMDPSKIKSSSLAGRYSSTTNNTTTTNSSSTLNSSIFQQQSSVNLGQSSATNGTSNGHNTSGISNGSSTTSMTMGVHGSSSYTSGGSGGAYRLASLDRLAQRQKLYEHSSAAAAAAQQQQQQNGHNLDNSKRELFFKNESSPAPALSTSINATGPPPNVPTHQTKMMISGGGEYPSAHQNLTSKLDGLRLNSNSNHNNMDQSDNREKELLSSKENKLSSKEKNGIDKEKKRKELDGYVGFANLPNQVYRKAVKRGFDFTLMVIGESGLGKSTLINSLFLSDIYSPEYPGPSHRIKKIVQVETCKVLLKENGVNFTLTIVDTPGFGWDYPQEPGKDWQAIVDYIESRYEDYLNAESRVNRKQLVDNRVHTLLYFISPSGHGLKPLDIEVMKKLHDKVNIIPVLAKADTMTPEECSHFKKQVLNEIAREKIKIYEFPDCDDEEENKNNKSMRDRVPFAVVGSNTIIEIDGKKHRGRKYPWGTVLVDNLEHCDFVSLRNMMIRTHLQDLKDVTNNVHYENFRCRKLAGLGPDGKPIKGLDKNPLAQMEDEKKNHDSKMKKMEQEMEQVFEMKVKERNQRLADSENDLRRREDQMKKALEKLVKEVEEKKKMFEVDRMDWERANGISFEELRRKSLEALSKEASKKPSMVTTLMRGRFGHKETANQNQQNHSSSLYPPLLIVEKFEKDNNSISTIDDSKSSTMTSNSNSTNSAVTVPRSSSAETDELDGNHQECHGSSSTKPERKKRGGFFVKRSKSMPRQQQRTNSFRGQECSQT